MVNKRVLFTTIVFLKFQNYFSLSFLSTALRTDIKTSPQEEMSPRDLSLCLGMEGQELNQSKRHHKRMKYLQNPILLDGHQLPGSGTTGELRDMHSCKVTANSTFPSQQRAPST